MSIEERVLTLIRDFLGSANDIQLDSEILNCSAPDINPFDSIEIVMRVEEEFRVDITEEEAEKLYTVQDIVNHIKTKQKEEK